MFSTTRVTVCICQAELKSYFLTYLAGAKRLGGELTKGRNVHKPNVSEQFFQVGVSYSMGEMTYHTLLCYR